MIKEIKHREIENILGFQISDELRNRVDGFNLEYRDLTKEERDEYILNFINVIFSDLRVAGKHRILDWENGWAENLHNFKKTKNIDDLVPIYHGKNKIVKWMGEPIMPLTNNFDYKIHICFVDAILQHYLKDIINIFEFGCGPGYHLLRLNEFNKNLNLNGSDWTKNSQNIINDINSTLNTNINSFNFDFFNPNYNIDIPFNSGIYTVAALEQVGENFKDMIAFLLDKKPKICIHMEPIDELLDDNKLIDSLSIKYFRKRNYLNRFLPYLENLEKEGKIEIIKKQRIFSGSYFTEGHSLIVWKIK
jgi:hypothetical protein